MMLLWPEVWAATYFEVASFKKSRLQAAEIGGARARRSGRSILTEICDQLAALWFRIFSWLTA